MKNKIIAAAGLLIVSGGLGGCRPSIVEHKDAAGQFQWPQGKRAAVSFSFDDGKPSQVDNGLPLFDANGVKATFFVLPEGVSERLEGWKKALAEGHEIGNHTVDHPCTINKKWVLKKGRQYSLEYYTLDKMHDEMLRANATLESMIGAKPITFAYPCGQSFVGRGSGVKSYVPLVGRLFLAGRGWLGESTNNPEVCDLQQVQAIKIDTLDFEAMKSWADKAAADGFWLVVAGHDIKPACDNDPFCTSTAELDKFLKYVQKPENGFWVEPVGTVAQFIAKQRKD